MLFRSLLLFVLIRLPGNHFGTRSVAERCLHVPVSDGSELCRRGYDSYVVSPTTHHRDLVTHFPEHKAMRWRGVGVGLAVAAAQHAHHVRHVPLAFADVD